jgi:hypothetical protein
LPVTIAPGDKLRLWPGQPDCYKAFGNESWERGRVVTISKIVRVALVAQNTAVFGTTNTDKFARALNAGDGAQQNGISQTDVVNSPLLRLLRCASLV